MPPVFGFLFSQLSQDVQDLLENFSFFLDCHPLFMTACIYNNSREPCNKTPDPTLLEQSYQNIELGASGHSNQQEATQKTIK
jgi:hypothetical protein